MKIGDEVCVVIEHSDRVNDTDFFRSEHHAHTARVISFDEQTLVILPSGIRTPIFVQYDKLFSGMQAACEFAAGKHPDPKRVAISFADPTDTN